MNTETRNEISVYIYIVMFGKRNKTTQKRSVSQGREREAEEKTIVNNGKVEENQDVICLTISWADVIVPLIICIWSKRKHLFQHATSQYRLRKLYNFMREIWIIWRKETEQTDSNYFFWLHLPFPCSNDKT